jgi:hypothetical protein
MKERNSEQAVWIEKVEADRAEYALESTKWSAKAKGESVMNDDKDFVEKELAYFRKNEIEAVRRLEKAKEGWAKARAELAVAREGLEGTRCMIREFEYEMDYLRRTGKGGAA